MLHFHASSKYFRYFAYLQHNVASACHYCLHVCAPRRLLFIIMSSLASTFVVVLVLLLFVISTALPHSVCRIIGKQIKTHTHALLTTIHCCDHINLWCAYVLHASCWISLALQLYTPNLVVYRCVCVLSVKFREEEFWKEKKTFVYIKC